jgi:hypothetical protein
MKDPGSIARFWYGQCAIRVDNKKTIYPVLLGEHDIFFNLPGDDVL